MNTRRVKKKEANPRRMVKESGLPSVWVEDSGTDRRVPLTAPEIVDAAVSIVEAEGVKALTMRRLAAELGTSTSSVYWRFADRDELLLAAADRVTHELYGAALTVHTGGLDWRGVLTEYGIAIRASFRANQDLLPLIRGRTGVTPSTLQFAEEVLRVLVEAGFSGERLRDAFNAYTSFVVGYSVVELARRPLSERWVKAIPRYLSSLSGDEFPHIAGSIDILREQAFFLRSTGDVAFDGGFRLGLEALLTGLSAAMEDRTGNITLNEVGIGSAGHPREAT